MSEPTRSPNTRFEGQTVVAFESRRADEMASIISTLGGRPLVAPSMREVHLADNPDAFAFAERLLAGDLDLVLLMTGVGTRALMEVLETRHLCADLVAALSRVAVVPRGPKPVKVLRELGVPFSLTVPEPNTWREMLATVDSAIGPGGSPLLSPGTRVAVQEYGVSSHELLDALRERGAEVTAVPVYRWALPEDLRPLKDAITTLVEGRARIALFTTGTQVRHLLQVAAEMGVETELRAALHGGLVASIGPTCSEALREAGLPVHVEPAHPRMGHLARAAAEAAKAQSQEAP